MKKKRQDPVQDDFDDGYYDDRRPADEHLNEKERDLSWLPNVLLVLGCVILVVIASVAIMHLL